MILASLPFRGSTKWVKLYPNTFFWLLPASRQLRRKVPYAGHLMTPRRLWLNKIPTQCDVVIEFPEDAPDEALRWLLARIRSQPPAGLGLLVQVKAHESTRRNAFYVSAPVNV